MDCNTSSTSPTVLNIQYFTNPDCFDCNSDCGSNIYNSKCVIYTGPNLPCSGISTKDSLETALQKIDEQICASNGDYSTYDMHCLPAWYEQDITTQALFVDAITGYACETRTNLDTFINTTFVTYQNIVNVRFEALEIPGITCAIASVTDSDTLQAVLNKYCTKLTSLTADIDITTVTWDSCLTVVTPPTTISDGFQLLATQICDVKDLIDAFVLPEFNNSGSCIVGTSADTLVETIELIKTRLCLTGTFDINALDWGCLVQPSVTQTDLQAAFQTVLDTLTDYTENKLSFSGDFVVTAVDGGDPCAGLNIALATPLNLDRFVAATTTDITPSVLIDKILAGDNIIFDVDAGVNGSITINSSSTDSFKVKGDASEADVDAGFLINKLETLSNQGITNTPVYNGTGNTVGIIPSIDNEVLWTNLYNYLNTNSGALTLFCNLASQCPLGNYATVTWSFSSGEAAIGAANTLLIIDNTNPSLPITLLSQNITAANTTLAGTLPLNTTLAGKILLISLTAQANNDYSDLTITDVTIPVIITGPLNLYVAPTVINSYQISSLVGGHTYHINSTCYILP